LIDGTLHLQSGAALRVLLRRIFRAASQRLGSASLTRLAAHLKRGPRISNIVPFI